MNTPSPTLFPIAPFKNCKRLFLQNFWHTPHMALCPLNLFFLPAEELSMWMTIKTDILIYIVDLNLLRLWLYHCCCDSLSPSQSFNLIIITVLNLKHFASENILVTLMDWASVCQSSSWPEYLYKKLEIPFSHHDSWQTTISHKKQ